MQTLALARCSATRVPTNPLPPYITTRVGFFALLDSTKKGSLVVYTHTIALFTLRKCVCVIKEPQIFIREVKHEVK